MTVELWLGHEFETTHEMKALRDFLARMEELYGADPGLYMVFANFYCQGEEIDLAVIKRNGIAIVELKDTDDAVVGRENGPWTATGKDGRRWQLNDGRRRNPFEQVRAYRAAMIGQLQADAPKFLPSGKAAHMRLDHVNALVTFCPRRHPNPDLQISLKWFSVVGLDELPQELYLQRSPALDFSKAELHQLAQTWRLKRTPTEGFLPAASVRTAEETPEATRGQAPAKEPAPAERPALSGQAVPGTPPGLTAPATQSAPAGLAGKVTAGEPSKDLEPWLAMVGEAEGKEEQCIVCKYQAERCDVAGLRGAITAANLGFGVGAALSVRTDDGDDVVLAMGDPHWADLVPMIKRMLGALEAEGTGRLARVAAYHLMRSGSGRVTAGPTSLVVLEPDWLINVTELTKIEYCPRSYLVGRFTAESANSAIVRGNIVHRTFEQMLRTPQDNAAIVTAMKGSFFEQARDLAILNETKATMWEQVKPHHDRLKKWVGREQMPEEVGSETFLLAPQLGLKGRIDVVWRGGETTLVVGELKTGKSYGANPNEGHAFQATAYGLMALARDWTTLDHERALILYTGNTEMGRALNVTREVALSPEAFRKVIDKRNLLVLIDYLADAPFEIRQINKCLKCSTGRGCEEVAVLLGHSDPRAVELATHHKMAEQYEEPERQWLRSQAALLAKEFREVKRQHATLWQKPPEARCADGVAIRVKQLIEMPEGELGRRIYLIETDDQSELHEEEVVLASNGRGPMDGAIAEGVVKRVMENGLEVEFKRPLAFEPKWVDRYVTEELLGRQFAGPFMWVRGSSKYRSLITRLREPQFKAGHGRAKFPPVVNQQALNEQQKVAVQRALEMEDYLLIQGPPGTGKTTLVAALVREFTAQGKRVLLAAGTNTAIDNLVKALDTAGLGEQVLRLGSANRADPYVRKFVPEVAAADADLDTYVTKLRRLLTDKPVVAATATTWLAGTWQKVMQFDVAIVDEAAQMTVPACLGALALANRFILIGDHRQLPAVVQSEPNKRIRDREADEGPKLSESLFEQLFVKAEREWPYAVVRLNEQYRMNEEICAIPRALWYEDLRPANSKTARSRLTLLPGIEREHLLAGVLEADSPVVFVDVPWAGSSDQARSNRREAELVRDLVAAYRKGGLAMESMGVIAPFKAQVSTIRRTLEAAMPGEAAAIRQMIDTVDRFQGQQREAIIISLATYGDFVHDLLQDERRLNVALTRAKHKLIVIGDRSVLVGHPVYYGVIKRCKVVRAP